MGVEKKYLLELGLVQESYQDGLIFRFFLLPAQHFSEGDFRQGPIPYGSSWIVKNQKSDNIFFSWR